MVKEKTTLEVLQEIQEKLWNAGYPVKLDIGEAIEGADLGIKVYVGTQESWKLEREINSIIQRTLRKYSLIPYLEWYWKKSE
jgi:hypothetical protein